MRDGDSPTHTFGGASPDTGSFGGAPAELSVAHQLVLDEACDAFEAKWRRGGRPDIRAGLLELPEPVRPAALAELVALDAFYRRKAGEAPAAADYAAHFPGLDPDWLAGVVAGETDPAARTGSLSGARTPGAPAELPSVPGFELLGELDHGGMGVVYKARQAGLNREVALKMLLAGAFASPDLRARFLVEAESVAALEHPHIVRVFAFGESGRHPYLAMEYLPGGTLAARIKAGGPLPAREAAGLVARLAAAAAHAHSRGVVHRDIKPGNVLFGADGQPRLADFGLAKVGRGDRDLSATGQVLGTPAYMSPEQAAGRVREVGTAADVYALGAVLYDALTGRPPFLGDSHAVTLQKVLAEEPARPRAVNAAVPRDLETVCLKCLEKEPGKRYATAEALARDVERYLADEPVEACPPSVWYRAWKFTRKHRTALGVAGAFALLLVAAVAVSARQAAAARAERDRAVAAQETLRTTLTRQVANGMEADLLRLSAVGEALAATLEQGTIRDEKQLREWMLQMLKNDPQLGGLSVQFEPDTFDLRPDLRPARRRVPPPPAGPDRDGYTLYVHRRSGVPAVVIEALALEYNYRSRDWYRGTLAGTDGWCEPSFDAYAKGRVMVSYIAPVRGPDGRIHGVLTVELSLAYFEDLGTLLDGQHFGPDSYGFVLNGTGRVVAHPRARLSGKEGEPSPKINELFPDAAFAPVVEEVLGHSGRSVGETTGTDPATGRRARFLYARFKPGNWVFVAVIPENPR